MIILFLAMQRIAYFSYLSCCVQILFFNFCYLVLSRVLHCVIGCRADKLVLFFDIYPSDFFYIFRVFSYFIICVFLGLVALCSCQKLFIFN